MSKLKKCLYLINLLERKGPMTLKEINDCYEYGLGAEVDLDKARDMFKQAGQSEKGHGKPEEHLAMLEVNEENYDEALRWFKEAQSKGNRTVKSYIWYLERKLN